MNVYVRGVSPESTTNAAVIVTVELCDQTDMKGIENHNGLFHNPFYRVLKVNCGKVVQITDAKGDKSFDCAQINWSPDGASISAMNVHTGKYFCVHGYNREVGADVGILHVGRYVTAYSNKAAVVERSGYVDPDYTGVAYMHYPNGLIENKTYYKRSKRYAVYHHRNDAFNTLQRVEMISSHNTVECVYEYNEREALTKETWYTGGGTIHSEICAKEPESEPEPKPLIKRPPRPNGLPPKPKPKPRLLPLPPVPETPLPDSDSESERTGSSDDVEPSKEDVDPDNRGGSGGARVKPRPPQDEDSASEVDC